jgi:hypothetical protein
LSDRLRQTAIRHVPVVNDEIYDILKTWTGAKTWHID